MPTEEGHCFLTGRALRDQQGQSPKLGFGCLWVLDLIQQSRPAGQDDSFSLQFMVYEVPGQDLEVDLYDEYTDRDDFRGR